MQSYIIYGAGGYAKLIIDLIDKLGGNVLCVFDDNENLQGQNFMGISIEKYSSSKFTDVPVIIAIGNNLVRKQHAMNLKHRFVSLIHPDASVSKFANIGTGTIVLAKAVIQAGANIDDHVIVNAGSCIDHDTTVDSFVHINPLAHVGSGASIGSGTEIGVGAIVMRGIKVANDVIIPPNCVITR